MVMPALHGNYIDLLILIFIGAYAWEGAKRGFLIQMAEMASFVLGFVLALRLYPIAANLLIANFSFSLAIANAVGFISVAVLGEIVGGYLLSIIFRELPKVWFPSVANRMLGVVPAALDGLILVAFVLTAVVALPVSGRIKSDILASRTGREIIGQTTGLEKNLSQIFGGAVEETLNFLTVQPGSSERIDLHFTTTAYSVDGRSEEEMLRMVNAERTQRGIRALILDDRLRALAREHSGDMFRRGYFSHVDPDGRDPFERMREAGISFMTAGENLAFAPNVVLAQNGLMNSPGHRANILNVEFGKVGIGVIDGGIYGKMFTQEFSN